MSRSDLPETPAGVRRPKPFNPRELGSKGQKQDQSVHKTTKVASKRIGGSLRAEQARQQKRRDAKRDDSKTH